MIRFENNYLRPQTPTVSLPGMLPDNSFREYGIQYDIDDLTARLLFTVGRKGWDLPDIDVTFYTTDDAESPFLKVSKISGGTATKKWSVRYGRLEYRNDKTVIGNAPHNIITPQQEMSLYHDGSGPTLYRYAGDDWFNDEEAFINGTKIHSKLNNEKKWYLQYTGDGDNMVVDNDLDRQYEAISFEEAIEQGLPLEFSSISKNDMFMTAERFLQSVITDIENRYPDHEQPMTDRLYNLSGITDREITRPVPPLVVVCDKRYQDEEGPIVKGNGYRFVSLGKRDNEGNPFPDYIYNGYDYAAPVEHYDMADDTYHLTPMDRRDYSIVVVQIKYENDIYVADQSVYAEKRRQMSFKADVEDRDYLNDEDLSEINTAYAETVVALCDYDGSYEKPIYLIGRPLMDDEARDITDQVKFVNAEDAWDITVKQDKISTLII